KRFCTRAILIDQGKIRADGEPRKIAQEYSAMNNEAITDSLDDEKKTKREEVIELTTTDANGKEKKSFKTGESLYVDMVWPSKLKGVKNAGIAIVRNSGEMMFGANTFKETDVKLKGATRYKVNLAIGPGKYYL